MPDDGVYIPDVLHVLEHATSARCANDPGTKWKLYGPLPNGADYAAVCYFKRDELVVVVTTHEPP